MGSGARRRRTLGGALRTLSALSPLPAGCLGLAGCTVELETHVVGSGIEVVVPHSVTPFDSLVASDGLEVRFHRLPTFLVEVHGHDNLVGHVAAVVDPEHGRLVVEVEQGYDLDPLPRVDVYAPELVSLSLSGSGRVVLDDLAGDELRIALAGSGDVVARGGVRQVRVRAVGSGDVRLAELLVQEADVEKTGSGEVYLTASDRVAVKAVGSGDVQVGGAAQVKSTIIGSGRIVRRDPR